MLNETWDALLPPGRGFVLIRDYQKYELTPGLPTGDGYSRFSISMFHQLHCLDYVRKTIYEIILKVQEGRREEIDISELDQVDHLPHCIDYIRQGIMCAGDTTMEGAVYDRHRTVVFGMGNPHLCRDFRAIYEFTKDNFETVF
ncbi:hypothetical protein BO82DRAFT_352531 [Aspergillus uvarum CBS 121591]|uniref:Uncharacterized protein n=1 Tax=Aspergillus uvarum CBS 121591 TaxID=1448315 RepID=A0A319CEW9_9EURO|nr:hypothetical protein BO82DRAFT_352531 [Aspergillus uvarum CBS 121591]PYH83784.1 hypothetical protein BO82DRAFT_352531 [Aspergillus uvarum CBS 121591]